MLYEAPAKNLGPSCAIRNGLLEVCKNAKPVLSSINVTAGGLLPLEKSRNIQADRVISFIILADDHFSRHSSQFCLCERMNMEKTALSDGHGRYLLDRLPLCDFVDGVRGQLNKLLVQPAWPSDLDLLHNGIRSESEMQAGIIC